MSDTDWHPARGSLHWRISESAFYQVSYTLLFATGLKLIWDASGL